MNSDLIKKVAEELSDFNDICDFLENIPEEVLEKYLKIDWDNCDCDLFCDLVDCCHFDQIDRFIELVNSTETNNEI